MSGKHWLYTIIVVVALAIGTYGVVELSGDPVPGDATQESGTTATEPGGPAAPGTPTKAPDQPVPPTPRATASPGETPAWRTGPSGETLPTGTNRTTVEGGTLPAGQDETPPAGAAR